MTRRQKTCKIEVRHHTKTAPRVGWWHGWLEYQNGETKEFNSYAEAATTADKLAAEGETVRIIPIPPKKPCPTFGDVCKALIPILLRPEPTGDSPTV